MLNWLTPDFLEGRLEEFANRSRSGRFSNRAKLGLPHREVAYFVSLRALNKTYENYLNRFMCLRLICRFNFENCSSDRSDDIGSADR